MERDRERERQSHRKKLGKASTKYWIWSCKQANDRNSREPCLGKCLSKNCREKTTQKENIG